MRRRQPCRLPARHARAQATNAVPRVSRLAEQRYAGVRFAPKLQPCSLPPRRVVVPLLGIGTFFSLGTSLPERLAASSVC